MTAGFLRFDLPVTAIAVSKIFLISPSCTGIEFLPAPTCAVAPGASLTTRRESSSRIISTKTYPDTRALSFQRVLPSLTLVTIFSGTMTPKDSILRIHSQDALFDILLHFIFVAGCSLHRIPLPISVTIDVKPLSLTFLLIKSSQSCNR